jgi:hypothetical protein
MKDTAKFGEISEMLFTLAGLCQRETQFVRRPEADGLSALQEVLSALAEAADRAHYTGNYSTLNRFASALAAAAVPAEVAFAGELVTDEQEGD